MSRPRIDNWMCLHCGMRVHRVDDPRRGASKWVEASP
jgi:hypothetical protein